MRLKVLILMVSLAHLAHFTRSCECSWQEEPDLFCDNPTWNAVKIRVKEIVPRDTHSRHDIFGDWLSSDREVSVVVENVWGSGGTKIGQEMTIWSHHHDSLCGVADLLVPGMTAYLWIQQRTKEMNVAGCALYRFKDKSSDTDAYLDSLTKC